MAFNLGAFAGGLVSSGLKTYTTLKEQERADAAEARDKTRFEEEQRKIELQRQAEDIARQAAIPTTGTGTSLKDITAALPIGSPPPTDIPPEKQGLYNELFGRFTPEQQGQINARAGAGDDQAYRQKFNEVFGGLTPQQQALVLRQYGDTSTPGGAALEARQRAASGGASGIPVGLNTAVVRQEASGERSVLPPEMDEKKIVARHKELAMASGNPLAIKAAHEAEATMLNRQVAQQQLAIGEQTIDLNKYNIKKAKTEQDFKDSWLTEMTAAKEDHFKLMKQIDTATSDPNATLDSLVSQFGPKLKDATKQTYSVKDGKIVTTLPDGTTTVVASDVGQASILLKQAAESNFAQDFQNRILSKGLFEKPADLADFIKNERDYFIKTGTLATQQVMAQAATKTADAAMKTAEAHGVTAKAAETTATANKTKIDAELAAKIPQMQANLLSQQAASAGAMASYHTTLSNIAKHSAELDAEGRIAMNVELDKYAALSEADKIGPKGAAILAQASVAMARKSGDINGALKQILGQEKIQGLPEWKMSADGSFRSNAEGVVQDYDPQTKMWKTRGMPEVSANAAKMGITAAVDAKGAVGYKGKDGWYSTEQEAVRSFKGGLPTDDTTSAATGSTKIQAAIDAAKKPVDATANVQSALANAKYDDATQKLIDNDPIIKNARANIKKLMEQGGAANISKATELQNKLDTYIGNLYKTGRTAPAAPAATPTPATALPAAKASAPAAPASAAIAATPAQVKAKLEAKIAGGEGLSTDELSQAKALGLIKEGGAAPAAPTAPAKKSIQGQADDLYYDMYVLQTRLEKDPKNWAIERRYKTAKEQYEAFKKANKLD
jgi:hypothetical protein